MLDLFCSQIDRQVHQRNNSRSQQYKLVYTVNTILDGFNTGRADVMWGGGPHYQDAYCDRNGGEDSQ
jgi:hypothetical protein